MCLIAALWTMTHLWHLPANLIHQRLELINVLKAAIHAGKPHVGYLVEFFELAHHQFKRLDWTSRRPKLSNTAAVFFCDHGETDFGPLVSGEALFAGSAQAPAADEK